MTNSCLYFVSLPIVLIVRYVKFLVAFLIRLAKIAVIWSRVFLYEPETFSSMILQEKDNTIFFTSSSLERVKLLIDATMDPYSITSTNQTQLYFARCALTMKYYVKLGLDIHHNVYKCNFDLLSSQSPAYNRINAPNTVQYYSNDHIYKPRNRQISLYNFLHITSTPFGYHISVYCILYLLLQYLNLDGHFSFTTFKANLGRLTNILPLRGYKASEYHYKSLFSSLKATNFLHTIDWQPFYCIDPWPILFKHLIYESIIILYFTEVHDYNVDYIFSIVDNIKQHFSKPYDVDLYIQWNIPLISIRKTSTKTKLPKYTDICPKNLLKTMEYQKPSKEQELRKKCLEISALSFTSQQIKECHQFNRNTIASDNDTTQKTDTKTGRDDTQTEQHDPKSDMNTGKDDGKTKKDDAKTEESSKSALALKDGVDLVGNTLGISDISDISDESIASVSLSSLIADIPDQSPVQSDDVSEFHVESRKDIIKLFEEQSKPHNIPPSSSSSSYSSSPSLSSSASTSLSSSASSSPSLLSSSSALPTSSTESSYPLFYLHNSKNTSIIQSMLNSRIDPNLKNRHNFAPLHMSRDNIDIYKLFIQYNADVNIYGGDIDDQATPLHLATNNDIIMLLLSSNANINLCTTGSYALPLHFIVTLPECITSIEHILTLDDTIINTQTIDGETPLHIASDLSIISLLLKYKANPNIRDNDGITPLHSSQSLQHTKLLLKANARPAADNNGINPPYIDDIKL